MRNLSALPTTALLALALLLSGCQASRELIGRTINISGEAALSDPQASLEMSDLAAGKDRILLNFWGSWCVPCRDEIPLLAVDQRRDGGLGQTGADPRCEIGRGGTPCEHAL